MEHNRFVLTQSFSRNVGTVTYICIYTVCVHVIVSLLHIFGYVLQMLLIISLSYCV